MGNKISLCNYSTPPLKKSRNIPKPRKKVVVLAESDFSELLPQDLPKRHRSLSLRRRESMEQAEKRMKRSKDVIVPVGIEFSEFYVQRKKEIGSDQVHSMETGRGNGYVAQPMRMDSVKTCGVD